MTDTVIRYLRLHVPYPRAAAQRHRDGILAIASVAEHAELATLLLVDMSLFGRGAGASVTNAIDVAMVEAHAALVKGFAIPLDSTPVVEWDSAGMFDLYCDLGDGRGYLHQPLFARERGIKPRSKEAFLSWAGKTGLQLIQKAEMVGSGAYAGAEG
jgi:hypothetical protein